MPGLSIEETRANQLNILCLTLRHRRQGMRDLVIKTDMVQRNLAVSCLFVALQVVYATLMTAFYSPRSCDASTADRMDKMTVTDLASWALKMNRIPLDSD